MTAKEILQKIKAVFEGTEVPAQAASTFASYEVDGGVTLYKEGEGDITTGDKVYGDATFTAPYPDGSYTLSATGVAFTVAAGVVTETSAEAVPPAATETQQQAPPAVLPPSPQFAAMEKKITTSEAEIITLKAELKAAQALAAKHEKIFPDLFELVEKLTLLPKDTPKTLTGREQEVFSRQRVKEEKMQAFAKNLKELREKV